MNASAMLWRGAEAVGEAAHRFRGFLLLPAARILLRDGRPVEIGSRAFDLLHVLLRARGTLVERQEIIRQVWPTTTVEESNLRFQISCLRRILGEDRDLLKTVPGRGYLMAAEISAALEPEDVAPHPGFIAAAGGGEALKVVIRAVLDELRAGGPQAEDQTRPHGHWDR